MKLYREIENSFPMIEKLFSQETLLEFKNATIFELHLYNVRLSVWIENNIDSFRKSLLYNLFVESGVKNTEEMSLFMILLFHYNLNIVKQL